ncbi:caffeoyl-CoA O-methyltransferase [Caldalkalibacillus uzonensis]|uniref:tRNA 5-hydroxyuridine methyltransferase n=1 Tax=Caldalkalibacillus uzonensis TaxID=353224 RepID=A0ABU0CT81_9BACI|nr:O-methyltransferase [Caldalkalibacillus uzonensis]MDQ0339554.1 caffeoyl-CoA O-methyltransferase [Caldalkalibacillus uzonensis]
MVIDANLKAYLQQLTPLDDPLLAEMEAVAQEKGIPIIERPSIKLIRVLLHTKSTVRRILEIGTAIGYSAIWLAQSAPDAHVDTIEKDKQRVVQARSYIERAGLAQRISVHHADAKTYAQQLQHRYDCIFIDAAKGQYRLLFEQYATRLNDGGLIISDNVFFRGDVAAEQIQNKRFRSLVNKLKAYNQWLAEHPRFETSFVPIGDGLAISKLKAESPEN